MAEPVVAGVALGSNLGDRRAHLEAAIDRLRALGEVTAVSTFLDTAPVGFLDQPRFLNGALLLRTTLKPVGLLRSMLAIERAMGRDRTKVAAKGPRVIDLDLIFYGQQVVATQKLTLPHPAMHERAFVLAPLAELAPEWTHPLSGLTIAAMLRNLP